MKIFTTQPSVVVYTANGLKEPGLDGIHQRHSTICLETCMLPNAINMIGQEGWPSADRVILTKDKEIINVTIHEFTNF